MEYNTAIEDLSSEINKRKRKTHRRSQNLRPSCPAVTIILELSGSLKYYNRKPHRIKHFKGKRKVSGCKT
jgi:hypothetical protein